jgi:DNA-binding NarL/FixJ family response regulator
MTIRLVVAEDHVAVRAGLVAYLDEQDDMEVVAEAENGLQACELVRELTPDLVLMDARMPVMDGIEATRTVKADHPATLVLLISAYEQAELLAAGTDAGADSFLLKGAGGEALVARVRGLVTGAEEA